MSVATASPATAPNPWVGSRGWMTTGQAARRLGYSRKTLLRWCQDGTIGGAVCSPKGEWRIPMEWVLSRLSPVVRRAPS